MNIICPKCGASNKEGSRFCQSCGEAIVSAEQYKYCSKCGNKLEIHALFCTKCGQKCEDSSNDIQQSVHNNVQTSPITPQYSQPQIQQQVNPYQHPQMQQQVNPYQQPQMQQQVNPYQQPQMQQLVNPYQQPQMQQPINPSPQSSRSANTAQAQGPIKGIYSNVSLIILGSITAVLLITVIIHGMYSVRLKNAVRGEKGDTGFFEGLLQEEEVPKTPKEKFVYQLSNIAPQFSGMMDDLGNNFFDMFVTVNEIDTSKSNVNDTNITISLVMDEDTMTFTSNQNMIYNADTHDTSLVMSGGLEGGDPTSCGYYYTDDSFLFVPTSASSPMIRYTLGEEADDLKKYAAVDRFANMVTKKYTEKEVDWDAKTKELEEGVLADLTDEDFEEGTAYLQILNENKECDTLTIRKTGHEGIELASAISDYLLQGQDNEQLSSSMDSITDEDSMSEEAVDDYNMTLIMYSIDDKAVGMRLSTMKDDQEIYALVVNYEDGKEYDNQFELNDPGSKTEFRGWDSAVSSGGNNYNYYAGFTSYTVEDEKESSNTVIMETSGTDTDSHKTQSGTFTIDTSGTTQTMSINGTVDYSADYSSGGYTSTNNCTYTVVSSEGEEMFHGTIVSDSTGKNEAASIDPPEFIEGSGIDVGSDHQELLNAFGEDFDDSLFSFNNRTIRTFAVYLQSMNVDTSSYIPGGE